LRRSLRIQNFGPQSHVVMDGRRTGLAFAIESETPIFGQLGAGGDIVRLIGTNPDQPGVSLLGLGDGGDYFEDRRLISTALNLNGNGGNDTIFGSAQDDVINGGRGSDRLQGNGGNDLLSGDRGHDHLLGNSGNDQLTGGNGHDVLQGGRGNDILLGGSGNDILFGELGDDLMAGGVGRDQFVVMPGSGNDTIVDFDPANDAIALTGGLTVANVQISAVDSTTSRVQFAGGSVTLNNLPIAVINPGTLFS
ncbi:MAG: calcium-binding protein, partial [Cyanobacteria bacterium P01_H01_bin.130]